MLRNNSAIDSFIFNDNKTYCYDRSRNCRRKKSIFKLIFGWVRQGVRVPSFHNFCNLGGLLKTRYDDAFGEKRKGDLYYKRITDCG